jgi:hypothetical protein
MPISKVITMPNGALVEFHKVIKIEIGTSPEATVTVGSWPSPEAYQQRPGSPLWNTHVSMPVESFVGNPVLAAEAVMLQEGDFSGGVQLANIDGNDLESLKARTRTMINLWRLTANRSSFQFTGKTIACDELSRSDIEGVNGYVALTGSLPPNFPGAWKAIDNSYVAIPDVSTWTQLFGAMVAQGTSNFGRSQALKGIVAAATTAAQLDAIHWSMELPAP